ncbi:UNVERIFIED_CONTAM: sensor histidine kinase, partial [Bacteroidetes bacterium 56_B9]
MSEMTKINSDRMKVNNRPFYASRNDDNYLVDNDVLDFHKTDSLLVRQFEDSEGKIIGFIGFAGREDTTPFTDEE